MDHSCAACSSAILRMLRSSHVISGGGFLHGGQHLRQLVVAHARHDHLPLPADASRHLSPVGQRHVRVLPARALLRRDPARRHQRHALLDYQVLAAVVERSATRSTAPHRMMRMMRMQQERQRKPTACRCLRERRRCDPGSRARLQRCVPVCSEQSCRPAGCQQPHPGWQPWLQLERSSRKRRRRANRCCHLLAQQTACRHCRCLLHQWLLGHHRQPFHRRDHLHCLRCCRHRRRSCQVIIEELIHVTGHCGAIAPCCGRVRPPRPR